MRVLITGSSGLLGTALQNLLIERSHIVARLVRAKSSDTGNLYWDPEAGVLDAAQLEGFDAIVHLAGHTPGAGRMTAKKKGKIFHSRIDSTRLLCEKILTLQHPPKVFVCASGIGYYGNRPGELLTETSSSGSDFLAEVCQQWEAETQKLAKRPEIRIVNMRIGFVLSPKGGGLAKMLPAFKLGIAGKLGNGKQYMSWISLEDTARAMLHILSTNSLSGPVNIVAPHPVTNEEFTKTLGNVIHRPTVIPVPAFLLRLLFGEGADMLVLCSQEVKPAKLQQSGFVFSHPNLPAALKAVL